MPEARECDETERLFTTSEWIAGLLLLGWILGAGLVLFAGIRWLVEGPFERLCHAVWFR